MLGEIKSTQTALKDVEKLLKMDPGNTELLAQKEKLLAQAVDETKQKLETLKTAAEQANTALANGDISQEQYDALQRKIVETEQNVNVSMVDISLYGILLLHKRMEQSLQLHLQTELQESVRKTGIITCFV